MDYPVDGELPVLTTSAYAQPTTSASPPHPAADGSYAPDGFPDDILPIVDDHLWHTPPGGAVPGACSPGLPSMASSAAAVPQFSPQFSPLLSPGSPPSTSTAASSAAVPQLSPQLSPRSSPKFSPQLSPQFSPKVSPDPSPPLSRPLACSSQSHAEAGSSSPYTLAEPPPPKPSRVSPPVTPRPGAGEDLADIISPVAMGVEMGVEMGPGGAGEDAADGKDERI